MKRAGKCVNKRRYPYHNTAVDMAHWKYINEGLSLGVYECPTCLDFHLTSKYCNLVHLHKQWRFTRCTWTGTQEQIKKNLNRQRRRLQKKNKIVANQISTTGNQENKRKALEYKRSIVPIAKQREIFATLDNTKKVGKTPFWARVLAIIVGTHRA